MPPKRRSTHVSLATEPIGQWADQVVGGLIDDLQELKIKIIVLEKERVERKASAKGSTLAAQNTADVQVILKDSPPGGDGTIG